MSEVTPTPVSPRASAWSWVAAWILSVALCALVGYDLGRLSPSPSPIPVPTPPGPAPTPFPPQPIPPTPNPTPVPTPAADFFRLGGALGGAVRSTYADALESVATQLAAGLDVSTALASVDPAWKAARIKNFDAQISPALTAIAPDPTKFDATQRAALVDAFRGLAKGVRGQ